MIGNVIGPEVDLEKRLTGRIGAQLDDLSAILLQTELTQLRDSTIADRMAETCFNLRRLLEVRGDQSKAKGNIIGFAKGKKDKSLWEVIGVCHHLMAFHWLTSAAGALDKDSTLVVHSDRQVIGFVFVDFEHHVRRIIECPTLPHFGVFNVEGPGSMLATSHDAGGRPNFFFIIAARSGALKFSDFYWTPLKNTSPGLLVIDSTIDLAVIIADCPELQSDSMLKQALPQALRRSTTNEARN